MLQCYYQRKTAMFLPILITLALSLGLIRLLVWALATDPLRAEGEDELLP